MDMIYADASGNEIGFLTDYSLDLEVGGNNDFQIDTPSTSKLLDFGYGVYINGTEYGGIVSKIVVDTSAKKNFLFRSNVAWDIVELCHKARFRSGLQDCQRHDFQYHKRFDFRLWHW